MTAVAVDRAQRLGRPVLLPDGNGLYFRKQTARTATWTLRYRYAGRDKWLALGNYPDMSLAQARTEARQARVLVDKGVDPMAERRATLDAMRRQRSFRQLAEDWYVSEVRGRLKHPEVPRRHLDKYLLPALGSTPAADISTDQVTRMLDRIRGDYPTAANDLLRFTKRIFDFGMRRHSIRFNPAAALSPRKDGGGKERPRDRALSEDELRTLFRAINQSTSFGEPNAIAVKLLLSLCVRKTELLAAEWSEFELERSPNRAGPVWHLPAARTKTGEALDIPLAAQAVAWLKRLRTLAVDSEYVFPRRRHAQRSRYGHVGVDTLNAALSQLDHGVRPFTVHDFRRTARTMLARQGARMEVAERCLGHKLKGVVGTYDTHDYFDERRAALTQLASSVYKLTTTVIGRNGDVAPRTNHRENP